MIKSLLVSLALTLIIETAVALLLGIRGKHDIAVVLLVNIMTNPVVVFTVNCVMLLRDRVLFCAVLAVMEILAFIAEAIAYKKTLNYEKLPPFAVSLICNVTSFGTGIIINAIR